jgi:exoribonuclease R
MLQTKDYQHFRVGNVEFSGAQLAFRALPGDTVLIENRQIIRILERGVHKQIVGTLELASKVRYGITSKNYPIYQFTPFAESYPPFFVGCSQKDVSQNVLAIIDFLHWDDGTCPRGSLVRTIGPCGDIAAEEEALAAHASPVRWKKLGELIRPPLVEERPRGITFHVDPPGCKDIDDAITLNPLAGHNMKVSIHIADVSSWLIANPELMEKASQISQTLYRDGAAIHPMFPAELSEDAFSLLPGQERRAWTFSFIWNSVFKNMILPEWSLETIRVAQTFSYHSVSKSMLAGELEKLCSGLAARALTDPHEWIEQLMILYNCEAAKLLHGAGVGVLRRHAAPDEARFNAYEAAGLPAPRLAMSAGEYCAGSDSNTYHWGLEETVYCHATSPIRRWSDCLNQLALRRIILKEDAEKTPATAIEHLNLRSKALKAYKRDLTFMRAVLDPKKKDLDGTVAETGRVWVPGWGRIVKAETGELSAGTKGIVKYFCDATKRNWKRRIIVKFEPVVATTGA